jgi:hypothetical protein
MQEDEAVTNGALKLLGSRRNDAYEAALTMLRRNRKPSPATTRKERREPGGRETRAFRLASPILTALRQRPQRSLNHRRGKPNPNATGAPH